MRMFGALKRAATNRAIVNDGGFGASKMLFIVQIDNNMSLRNVGRIIQRDKGKKHVRVGI